MSRWALAVFSILASLTIFAQVTNYEAEGNLKSDTKIKLTDVKDITNKNNPVDIFELVRAKVKHKKYDEAAVAGLIAYAYGIYDTHRVEDETAHQAVLVLLDRAIGDLSENQKKKFLEATNLLMEDKERVLGILNKVGRPDYYPRYMVQHGMGAFVGNKHKDGLVPDFDPEKAWKDTLVEIFPK
jgi:hypothetical protein